MGIMAAAFAQMMATQFRESSKLAQRLATLDTEKLMIGVLSDGSVCTKLLTQPAPAKTFDASLIGTPTPPTIDLGTTIPVSTAPNAPAALAVNTPASLIFPRLIPTAFSITNIKGNPGGNQFSATVQVDFDQTQTVYTAKPATVQVTLVTTGAGNVKTASACLSTVGGGGGGTTQQDMCTSIGGTWDPTKTPPCSLSPNLCNGVPVPVYPWGGTDPGQCLPNCSYGSTASPGYYTCTATGWQCLGWTCTAVNNSN